MSHIAPLIPENAPFTSAQRAWINGWLAGYLATSDAAGAAAASPSPPAPARSLVRGRFDGARRLNRDGSEKDTRHIVFHIDEMALAYDVGDSLGVHAANCPELVAALIERLGARAGDAVLCPDGN